MPDGTTTTGLIELETTGAEEAASDIRKTATALTDLGQTVREADGTTERSGGTFRDFRRSLGLVSPEAARLTHELHFLERGAHFLEGELSAISPVFATMIPAITGILAVGAALALVFFANSKAAKEVAESTEKNYEAHRKLVEGYNDAVIAGVHLTQTQRDYLRALKDVTDAEKQGTIESIKSKIATQQQMATSGSFFGGIAEFGSILLGLQGLQAKFSQGHMLAGLEVKKLTADLESLAKTGMTVEEALKAEGAELAKVRDYAKAAADAHRQLRKERDTTGTKGFQIDVDAINVERETKIRAAKESIKDADRLATAIHAINSEAADKSALAWIKEADRIAKVNKEASDKAKKAWDEATAKIESATVDVGVGLLESFRTGTTSAQQVFKTFTDAIIQDMERMAIKSFVSKIFAGMFAASTGGVGALSFLPHFDTGGTIPGPTGMPVPFIGHGGERVTSNTGTGGGPSGDGPSVHIHVQGGVGGLDSHSLRIINRQMRHLILSRGEQPLV